MNDTPTTDIRLAPGPDAACGPDWAARVAEVGPLAEAAAPEADRNRRLSVELMTELHARELFRMLLPRAQKGHEMALPEYVRVIEAIASFDASTAWCVCQANCCAMIAAYIDRDIADRMWGNDPKAVLAWGPGTAQASVDDGGYRLTARSTFVSGSHHATWLGVHGPSVMGRDGKPILDKNGKPEIRTFFFPASATELIENWDVLGLRGTGSDCFEVENLHVPEGYTVLRATMSEDRPSHGSGPLYAFPQMPVHAAGFASTALGTARGFITAFLEMAQTKVPRLHAAPLRDNANVQEDLAIAEARLSAARAWLFEIVEQSWEAVCATGEMPVDLRNRMRLAATHAIRESKAAVDMLYDASGASSVFASSPFERRFRDIHMVAQQVQGRKAHYRTVGAWLLGHPADVSVV